MHDLKEDLDDLHDLSDARTEAKKWREKGMQSLSRIKYPDPPVPKLDAIRTKSPDEEDDLSRWIYANNLAEIAWLVQVVSNKNMREIRAENDVVEVRKLRVRLEGISIYNLFPEMSKPEKPDNTVAVREVESSDADEGSDNTVPVLVAARVLRALTADPETVFSKATMLCYYRIIRELYYADRPDWTIGAGRAGEGGRMSAFITSECIRSIFAFEKAIRRTSQYFECTLALYRRYTQLEEMLRLAGEKKGGLCINGLTRPSKECGLIG
jgi:hypothetical protein